MRLSESDQLKCVHINWSENNNNINRQHPFELFSMADVCLFVIFCVFTHALDFNGGGCVSVWPQKEKKRRKRERKRAHQVICTAECHGANLEQKCLH